jgi:hypothetical protein
MSIGVIFYKLDKDNKLKLLLYERNSILEDIGGNNNNNNLDDIINHLLNKSNFKIDLNNIIHNHIIYNKNSNHKILLIKAPKNIANLTHLDFGKYEIYGINTLIKRTINWIDVDRFKIFYNTNLIHPRIKSYNLLNIFDVINEELNNDKVMNQIKRCILNT